MQAWINRDIGGVCRRIFSSFLSTYLQYAVEVPAGRRLFLMESMSIFDANLSGSSLLCSDDFS
ncbi:MAG: hypothetical protein D3923_15270 [Candidatus Electrothrix sp. AR3]|nr:hypothetical protein [Candidatus Electrothrix sp. AR3]